MLVFTGRGILNQRKSMQKSLIIATDTRTTAERQDPGSQDSTCGRKRSIDIHVGIVKVFSSERCAFSFHG